MQSIKTATILDRRLYSKREVHMNTNRNNIGWGFGVKWTLATVLSLVVGMVVLFAVGVPEGMSM
jgi:hypothetical protein